MKKIALQKLVEAAEACKEGMKRDDASVHHKELLSRAYAYITKVIENSVEEEADKDS